MSFNQPSVWVIPCGPCGAPLFVDWGLWHQETLVFPTPNEPTLPTREVNAMTHSHMPSVCLLASNARPVAADSVGDDPQPRGPAGCGRQNR